MELKLFSRDYCHLCHDMLAALEVMRSEPELPYFNIVVTDVDGDPQLVAKYDELVPVLVDSEGRELCRYFLDTVKVREYLNTFR
ncbi:MAG: glutaredoxin family protein [Sulfuritalea sp.]|nr:glutaredoxin family protein [Sulfuritalea sp.]